MVERPDSEPSLAEAIASFHPHKPASPKHKAGVLKRGECERNSSSGPLLGLTCATEREWRDEKRPDCRGQAWVPHTVGPGQGSIPQVVHIHTQHITRPTYNMLMHHTYITLKHTYTTCIHTTCSQTYTHTQTSFTDLHTTHNTLKSTHYPQACPLSGLSSKA